MKSRAARPIKFSRWSKFGSYVARKVLMSDGRNVTQYQHRAVMERRLGRKLKRSEHVHHKDGDPSNNRVKNLELITASDHAKEHAKNRPPEMFRGICPECGARFMRKARWVRNNQGNQGKAGPFCGKRCAGRHNARIGHSRNR